MPFLHLPVQSGSDKILAAMNRRHTANDYRRLVDRLREARPNLALSSDFIVGFPGEADGFCRDPAPSERYQLQSGFLIQVQPAARYACVLDGGTSSRRCKA